jgi:hypothetical protein
MPKHILKSVITSFGTSLPKWQSTTWIQSRCSQFFVGSSPSKYTVVHSQFYLTFLTINHLLPEIIYSSVSIQFTPCQPFLDIVVANHDVCFTTHLWNFVSYTFLCTVRSDKGRGLYSLKILVTSWSRSFLSDFTTPVIYSEECKVELGMDNCVLTWRRPDKELTAPWLNPGRGDRVSLMIWGCITNEGVGTLTVFGDVLNMFL